MAARLEVASPRVADMAARLEVAWPWVTSMVARLEVASQRDDGGSPGSNGGDCHA